MPRTASSPGAPAGARATGATNAAAHRPYRSRSRTDVQNTSGVTRSSGPVAGVEAITYSSAAPAQQVRQEAATVAQPRATGPPGSSRAQTVTTARAIPIANQARKRGSQSPSSGRYPGTNIATV
ncbi:hypothetical protein GCM10023085_30960 [Actinomadura viridis]